MTRAERRTKQRTREAAAAGLHMHSTRRAPAELTANPNTGKRHPARMDCTDERTARKIRETRRDYRPLTVRTVIDFDRIGRKRPAYTTDGYTV